MRGPVVGCELCGTLLQGMNRMQDVIIRNEHNMDWAQIVCRMRLKGANLQIAWRTQLRRSNRVQGANSVGEAVA